MCGRAGADSLISTDCPRFRDTVVLCGHKGAFQLGANAGARRISRNFDIKSGQSRLWPEAGKIGKQKNARQKGVFRLERETRLEPATFTLAR